MIDAPTRILLLKGQRPLAGNLENAGSVRMP